MLPNRLKNIIIKPHIQFGTHYDVGPWSMPYCLVEEYNVYYGDKIVAKFWLSDEYEDSIQLFTPMDVEIVEHIFSEMKCRRFLSKG